MKFKILVIFIEIIIFVNCLVIDEIKLKKHLFITLKYDARSIPPNRPINAYLQFKIVSLLIVDTQKNQAQFKAEVLLEWYDERLTWNPKQFGNIWAMSCTSNQEANYNVWIPDFIIYESVEISFENLDIGTLGVIHNGKVRYTRFGIINMNFEVKLHYYPYDEQTIKMTLISWRYPYNVLKSQLLDPGIYIDPLFYNEHVTWSIKQAKAYLTIDTRKRGSQSTYGTIHLEIKILRNGNTIKNTLVIPSISLGSLSFVYYFIPKGNDMRVEYISTLIVTQGALLLMLSQNLPISNETVLMEDMIRAILLFQLILLAIVIIVNWKYKIIKSKMFEIHEKDNFENIIDFPEESVKQLKIRNKQIIEFKNEKIIIYRNNKLIEKIDGVIFIFSFLSYSGFLLYYLFKWFILS